MMHNTESERERRAFEMEILRALTERAKGAGWRKLSNSVFRELDSMFIAADLNVWLNADKTVWQLQAKPMAVDPVFWSIMDMEENEKEPLSLRASGAFVCDSVPISESVVRSSSLGPLEMAKAFLAWVDRQASRFVNDSRGPFSDLVKAHENYRARGAYAATLISSLIVEGSPKEAADTAEEFRSGKRRAVHEQTSLGRSFFDRSVSWLETNGDYTA
jgi:hypothetical protein